MLHPVLILWKVQRLVPQGPSPEEFAAGQGGSCVFELTDKCVSFCWSTSEARRQSYMVISFQTRLSYHALIVGKMFGVRGKRPEDH